MKAEQTQTEIAHIIMGFHKSTICRESARRSGR
jgi:hypothetical protein